MLKTASCILFIYFFDLYSFSCIRATADVGFLGQRMEQDAVLQPSLVLILCTFLLPARPASSLLLPPPPRLSRGCGERSMRGEVKKKRERRGSSVLLLGQLCSFRRPLFLILCPHLFCAPRPSPFARLPPRLNYFYPPVFFQGHRQIGRFFGPRFARMNVPGELSVPKL